jgi:NTP pyrophosphatase (non-canonical NTP hydrolase)
MNKRPASEAQVLLFPSGELQPPSGHDPSPTQPLDIVLSGTFRKDLPALKQEFQELQDAGFRIVSPTSVEVASEEQGFVYMQGEATQTPESIELRHLEAINRAQGVWLHAPDGYVGPSAALEVGFARSAGVPVFTRAPIRDQVLQALVTKVNSPVEVTNLIREGKLPPPAPAIRSFQAYYSRAALERGYHRETAQNTLLLMLEEFGELARAIRKKDGLKRYSSNPTSNEAEELADIFIYVVHLANVLGLDLSDAVLSKETTNILRFIERHPMRTASKTK